MNCWSQQPALRPSAANILSIASAPEFLHIQDVTALDGQKAVIASALVQPPRKGKISRSAKFVIRQILLFCFFYEEWRVSFRM